MRSRFRMTLVALLAVFAVGAVAAASASAKNPTWMTCKAVTAGSGKFEDGLCSKGGKGSWEASELLAGETKEVSSGAVGEQRIGITGVVIDCTGFKTTPGAKIMGGEPGTDEEVIVWEGCSIEGSPGCTINGKTGGDITTNTLASELVFLTKEAAEKGSAGATGTLLKPKTGEALATVTFGGVECPSFAKKPVTVTGEVVAENVEAGTHATKHELHFPTTRIATYWIQVEKTVAEEKVKRVEWGANAGVFSGTTFVKLTSNEAFWIA